MDRDDVASWAAERGIAIVWPEQYERDPNDYGANPCIDFGRVVTREPGCVLRPTDVDQLVECVRMLGERRIPYCFRGRAHSSGGQSLIAGGASIDMRGIAGVVEDRPDAEQIVVWGGTLLLDVIDHLHPQGRRPAALTDNPYVTVAGSLAVGGLCDTSHLDGMLIRHVDAITLLTPDGELHELTRGDELFEFSLAGNGQLGAIVRATVRTVRKPMAVVNRYARWESVYAFVRDAASIISYRLYDYLRARAFWVPQSRNVYVDAAIGWITDTAPPHDPGLQLIRPVRSTALVTRDMFAEYHGDPGDAWSLPTPAMEVSLPLPGGLDAWPEICARVLDGGVAEFLRHGAVIMVVPREPDLPLAPVPDTPLSLILVLRPRVPTADTARIVPVLQAIADRALSAGGRLYRISVEPDTPRFVERQLGEQLAAKFRALKARVDPHGLCNPGFLVPHPV